MRLTGVVVRNDLRRGEMFGVDLAGFENLTGLFIAARPAT
jgi:CobQ-like glutamine amidotransferase family enzyme